MAVGRGTGFSFDFPRVACRCVVRKIGFGLEICASQTDRSALQIFSCKFSEVFTHSFVTASTVGAIASLPPDDEWWPT